MSQSMVGLLAAVGAAMTAFGRLIRGLFVRGPAHWLCLRCSELGSSSSGLVGGQGTGSNYRPSVSAGKFQLGTLV